uniref:Uncharacterized protein n=1 Tax=viral metagenome TaxID=1070528 RepID=A0A6C0CBN1_9ZZZZ
MVTHVDVQYLSISVVRKEDYAVWETIITSEQSANSKNDSLTSSFYVNYPPLTKYRIINDFVLNQLDNMHTIVFPSKSDEYKPLTIQIIVTPKYGDKATTNIEINPKPLSFEEKTRKNLDNHKECMSVKNKELRNRIVALEQETQSLRAQNDAFQTRLATAEQGTASLIARVATLEAK